MGIIIIIKLPIQQLIGSLVRLPIRELLVQLESLPQQLVIIERLQQIIIIQLGMVLHEYNRYVQVKGVN